MAGIDFEQLDTANPEALAEAFAALEQGEQPEAKDVKQDAPAATVDEQQPEQKPDEQKAVDQQQGEQQQEPDPEGVATKDGKHIIPYSVLQTTRERATRAEQMLGEMQERVAKLEAIASAAGSQGAKQGESARTEAESLSEEDLESLKEDFPTVYKAMMAQKQMIAALESRVQPVQEKMQATEEAQQRTAAQQVQEAIDANPKLAFIQSNNAEAFELAKQFDATLRSNAAWADRPLSERFAKVTEMVEAAFGAIEMPGAKPTQQPAKQQSAEELKEAAKAKAAATAVKPVPTSLSEFPAGQHAAQDGVEALEQMTNAQLAEKFSKMTPDQMDAYFSTL